MAGWGGTMGRSGFSTVMSFIFRANSRLVVFGVSSEEYLNYALENWREWWALKGRDIVHDSCATFEGLCQRYRIHNQLSKANLFLW